MLTGKFYTMDPETEDLIRGDALQNGMVVMIEGNVVREDPESGRDSKYARARLMENNRWCEVTDLRFRGYDSPDSSRLTTFIGVYADGTKASRSFSTSYAWFVKKDSLPKPPETDLVDVEESADTPVDAETTMENYGETGSGVDEDEDSDTEEGPMARALREYGRPLSERRTVTKTEVVEVYGPGRLLYDRPLTPRRRGW